MNKQSNLKSLATVILIGLCVILFLIGGCMYLIPKYNVWQQEQAGKAEFAKAEQNRRIKIEEAKANLEAEKLNAQAEIERAKGAAEVGVLKVIERAGIPIDYIAGTSIGSIVGGLYAAGYSAAQLDTMFCRQEWLSLLTDRRNDMGNEPYIVKDGVTYIFGFPVMGSIKEGDIGGFGVMRGERIEQVIDSMVSRQGCRDFQSLKIPFRCVAADFRSATEIVFSEGRLSKAIRASIAIPGIFKPVNHGDRKLVDGGMLNNLPVDVVKSMGAEIIIAVDLQQGEQTHQEPDFDFSMISGVAEMLGFGGLLDWVQHRPDIKKYSDNVHQATIYIQPSLPDIDASSFGNKNSTRMIKIGEDEAMKHWNQ